MNLGSHVYLVIRGRLEICIEEFGDESPANTLQYPESLHRISSAGIPLVHAPARIHCFKEIDSFEIIGVESFTYYHTTWTDFNLMENTLRTNTPANNTIGPSIAYRVSAEWIVVDDNTSIYPILLIRALLPNLQILPLLHHVGLQGILRSRTELRPMRDVRDWFIYIIMRIRTELQQMRMKRRIRR